MPRFVVLTHDWPFLHWDLMLQQGDVLRTWRLARAPESDDSIDAEALADHRLAYLDYQGPVSGGRGSVECWDAGTYEIVEQSPERLVAQFAGQKLKGLATVERAGNESEWTFRRLSSVSGGS